MTDIAERLRRFSAPGQGWISQQEAAEAADEIEKLRDALHALLWAGRGTGSIWDRRETARALLTSHKGADHKRT